MRLTKKAPNWFVFVKNSKGCFGKVYSFVEKRGVPAKDRAVAYAKTLARRNPGKRVYVARPNSHTTLAPARREQLDIVLI